jgi:hypothetical protein
MNGRHMSILKKLVERFHIGIQAKKISQFQGACPAASVWRVEGQQGTGRIIIIVPKGHNHIQGICPTPQENTHQHITRDLRLSEG